MNTQSDPNKVAISNRASSGNSSESLDVFGFRTSHHYKPINMQVLQKPCLVVIVDVEEEFNWNGPFRRENTSVQALSSIDKAHQIFRNKNVVPTYLLDYPVVRSDFGKSQFRTWRERGECVVGVQMHAWVNPPFTEEICIRNSYIGNLSPDLEKAKLAELTQEVADAIGVQPVIYKAGRYGLGPNSIKIIEDAGYLIDTSVMPATDFRPEEGPNFRGYDSTPFFFGRSERLLEIPVTRGFSGYGRRSGAQWLYHLSTRKPFRGFHLSGMLARMGLIERITLTPEGTTLAEMIKLTRTKIFDGCRLLTLHLHSPSLLPGSTPYVQNEKELDVFLAALVGYLEFFQTEVGGVFMTPIQIRDLLLNSNVLTA